MAITHRKHARVYLRLSTNRIARPTLPSETRMAVETNVFMDTVEDVLKSWNSAYAFSCVGEADGVAEFAVNIKLPESSCG